MVTTILIATEACTIVPMVNLLLLNLSVEDREVAHRKLPFKEHRRTLLCGKFHVTGLPLQLWSQLKVDCQECSLVYAAALLLLLDVLDL